MDPLPIIIDTGINDNSSNNTINSNNNDKEEEIHLCKESLKEASIANPKSDDNINCKNDNGSCVLDEVIVSSTSTTVHLQQPPSVQITQGDGDQKKSTILMINSNENGIDQSISSKDNNNRNSIIETSSGLPPPPKHEEQQQQEPIQSQTESPLPIDNGTDNNTTDNMELDINSTNSTSTTPTPTTTTTTTTTTTSNMKLTTEFPNGSCNYYVPKQLLPPQTADSLIQICIGKICQNIHTMTHIKGGSLPEDILQKIITLLIQQDRVKGGAVISNQLDDVLLARLISANMHALDIEGAKLITASSLKSISTTCSQIRKLSLANCTNFSSDALSALSVGCKSLEVLILKGCYQVTNPGIVAVARGCPNLYVVDFSGCMKITDSAVHELFQHCRQLHSVDLRKCVQLTDAAFQSFSILTLVNLDLLECVYITDQSISNITTYSKSLNSIRLSGKNITDTSLHKIAENCRELTILELVLCESITDRGIQKIGRSCRSLNSLIIGSSKNITSQSFVIDDSTMTTTAGGPITISPSNSFTSISSLNLSSSMAIDAPKIWSNLTTLNLNRCIAINDSAILSITNQAPLLDTVCLAWCSDISDESIIALSQRCLGLKNLDLTKCSQITDTCIIEVAKRVGNTLCRLILYSCTQVTDASIVEVANRCSSLIHLDVSQCEKITDTSLLKISQGLRQLRVLCMEECIVTDVGVSSLGEIAEGYGCQYLEIIKFGYCRFISDTALLKLCFGCPFVGNLDLSYCSNLITPRAIRTAIKSWSRLHTLRLRGYLNLANENIIDSCPPKLKIVNLSWCANMEDQALINFVKSCPSIETLDISRCPKITDNSLESIVDSCPSIRVVNVSGCKEITPFTVQKLSSLGKTIYR